MGTGMDSDVHALAILASGDVVAGGNFATAGGTVAPFLARWTCVTTCDDIDFNNNGNFPEEQDRIDFLNVLAGGDCAACNDIDFNNNGVFPEDQDVVDFFNVLAGGTCS